MDDNNPIKNYEELIEKGKKLGATITDERIEQIMVELGINNDDEPP